MRLASLPWASDVACNEGRLRVRGRHAITDRALLNRLAVLLLRQGQTVSAEVKCKRRRTGWDEH